MRFTLFLCVSYPHFYSYSIDGGWASPKRIYARDKIYIWTHMQLRAVISWKTSFTFVFCMGTKTESDLTVEGFYVKAVQGENLKF